VNEITIGQLAERAKVKVSTVRYYERRRLLAEPSRGDSGYRQYAPETEGLPAYLRFEKSPKRCLRRAGQNQGQNVLRPPGRSVVECLPCCPP
jgi:hypothetical protein